MPEEVLLSTTMFYNIRRKYTAFRLQKVAVITMHALASQTLSWKINTLLIVRKRGISPKAIIISLERI